MQTETKMGNSMKIDNAYKAQTKWRLKAEAQPGMETKIGTKGKIN